MLSVVDCSGKINSSSPVTLEMRRRVSSVLGYRIRGCFGALILEKKHGLWIRPTTTSPELRGQVGLSEAVSLADANQALFLQNESLLARNALLESVASALRQDLDRQQEEVYQLQLEVMESRQNAPETQADLNVLRLARSVADREITQLRSQLESYDSLLFDLPDGSSHRDKRQTLATDVLASRSREWSRVKQDLQLKIQDLQAFQQGVDDQGLLCDACQIGVKRHGLQCKHGLCHTCAHHAEVTKCPLCRAAKKIVYSLS